MRPLLLTLSLLFLSLLVPARARAQVILGQPCPPGAAPATSTAGITASCVNIAPNTWIWQGSSSDPQGGGTSTLPTGLCNGYLVKQGDYIIENDTGDTAGGTFTLTWRMILATGERREFQQVGLPGSTTNGPTLNGFPLVEGCLVGGSLYLATGGVEAGRTYAQVFLGRNGNSPIPNATSIQLIGCSMSSFYSVGWNGTSAASCRMPSDGQGYNQTIAFSNPAAGANLVNGALSGATIIGQKHWLANVRFTLTSSATAQARQACITFKDVGGNVYYGNCIQGTQAASLIVNYDFTAGVGAQYPGAATLIAIPSTNVAATANEVQGTLPSNLQFADASTISITIIGIQAGDQLSNIVVRTFWSHHVTD